MPAKILIRGTLTRFADELLLYSGQYALFYVLMNFSKDSCHYFNNFGHTVLLFILIMQTVILSVYGKNSAVRFWGSLIAPFFYTLIEAREGMAFVLNTGHVFFWIFSIITGGLQAFENTNPSRQAKKIIEVMITTINVTIFLFVYFLFDMTLTSGELYASGVITKEQFEQYLEVSYFFQGLRAFLLDPSHLYIIFGGAILSLSLAMGRIRIITLKDRINELFGRYVDKDIRDKIIHKGAAKSEKRDLCVLFSDIRDFTSISENHQPEEITEMLNYYFTEWENVVSKNGGIIDKYIGDAIMVLFGVKDGSHACDDAVKCSVEMLNKLPHIKQELIARNLPAIVDIGIGINYGEIIIGDIGSKNRLNYTVIGDNVNIASRLESLCKKYGQHLIISEQVYSLLDTSQKKRFFFLDKTWVKGKTEKIIAYSYNAD